VLSTSLSLFAREEAAGSNPAAPILVCSAGSSCPESKFLDNRSSLASTRCARSATCRAADDRCRESCRRTNVKLGIHRAGRGCWCTPPGEGRCFGPDGHGVGVVDGGVSVGSHEGPMMACLSEVAVVAGLVEALELVCFDPAAGPDERGRRLAPRNQGLKPSRSWFMARCQTSVQSRPSARGSSGPASRRCQGRSVVLDDAPGPRLGSLGGDRRLSGGDVSKSTMQVAPSGAGGALCDRRDRFGRIR
jgi:hypothetical protein